MKDLRINFTILKQPQKLFTKTFVNDTKISLISPLLVGNQLVPDFSEKANLFNDYCVVSNVRR